MVAFVLILTCSICFSQILQPRKYIDSLEHELIIAKVDTGRVIILGELCWVFSNANFYSLNVYSKQGLALARQINFPKGEVFILINQAIALELQGDIPASMELSFKALQIAESIQDTSGMAFSKSTLGNAYWYLKDYTKAIAFSKMHYNY